MNMLPLIADSEQRINPTGKGITEDRGLAHVLEKMAQLAEMDPAVVALEYLRYRTTRGMPAVNQRPEEVRAAGAGISVQDSDFGAVESSSPRPQAAEGDGTTE